MSHPINGVYTYAFPTGSRFISLQITSHDEASGKFSATLSENEFTTSPTTHNIKGGFSFNRDTSSTSFYFETPTDSWALQSPYLESPNQFALMNATRSPKDKSQPPESLALFKANSRIDT